MSTTDALVRFAIDLTLDDLPRTVVERARLRILDTLAVAIAGSRSRPGALARDIWTDEMTAGPSSVLGTSGAAHPAIAAFANGISAHALEYDDITSSAITHTSATVFPAVLAVAEAQRASGKALMEAYVASFEVATRIGWGMDQLLPAGWHPNGVLGVIGGAAGVSRLLGSSRQEVAAAVGIAASCSSGLRKNVGSMTKPFHMGHAAGDAVIAGQLASRGFTADTAILDRGGLDESRESTPGHHAFSFPDVYVGVGNFSLERMTEGLGKVWELGTDSTITRFHPGSTFPQPAIDETLALIAANDIQPQDVQRIDVGVTPKCLSIAPYSAPKDGMAARFCVAYPIAVAVLDRIVGIAQYEDERVQREDATAMMDRIVVSVPDELAGVTGGWEAGSTITPVSARITIHTKRGKSFSGARDTTKGFPGSAVTWEDVAAKFRECSSGVLSPDAAERCIEITQRLEDLDDVRELTSTARTPVAASA